MIHPEVKRLLQEVFTQFDEEEGKRAEKYPEVYLISLLENIKERLPEVSAMLYSTVEMAGFGSDTRRFNGTLAKVKAIENTQNRQTDIKRTKRQNLEKVST